MEQQILTVSLPSDVLYVSGTVNGTDTVWTNVSGNTWETTADRSANDVYAVSLTIVNGNGLSYAAELTLYYGILNLIYDRTQEDVTAKNEKGTYNASDLNRVGEAVRYLSGRLLSLGYSFSVNPKTNWAVNDIPRQSEIAAYFADLHTLKGIPTLPDIKPDIPAGGGKLTFAGANNIELYLYNLGAAEESVRANFVYAGEMYTGEV